MRQASSGIVWLTVGAALGTVPSCASSGMTPQMSAVIPSHATGVKLKSSLPPAELYAHAYRFLRDKGFRFTEANESMTSISTEGMAVGKSEIQLRVDLVIARADSGSVLSATADYLLTPGNWRPVAYRDSGTKYKVGFEELALLMQQLPHDGEIQYTVDEDRSRRAFSF